MFLITQGNTVIDSPSKNGVIPAPNIMPMMKSLSKQRAVRMIFHQTLY